MEKATKVIIIDDHLVITGSFNFTQTADAANDDNVLLIDNTAVAQQYEAEFARLRHRLLESATTRQKHATAR